MVSVQKVIIEFGEVLERFVNAPKENTDYWLNFKQSFPELIELKSFSLSQDTAELYVSAAIRELTVNKINNRQIPQIENLARGVVALCREKKLKSTQTLTVDRTKSLGSGAFGEVFQGELDGKNVAVKVTTKRNERDTTIALGDFYSCGIAVQHFCWTKEKNEFLLVMEYYAKGTLYARQLLEILDVLQKSYFIHGDIKSNNILITDDDKLKLVDFGSAQIQTEKHPRFGFKVHPRAKPTTFIGFLTKELMYRPIRPEPTTVPAVVRGSMNGETRRKGPMNPRAVLVLALLGLLSQGAEAGRMNTAFARLYSGAGAALVADLVELPEGPSPACVDKVANAILEELANLEIVVEDGVFDKMGDQRTYEKMCRVYRENIASFEGCPQREKESPSALIVLLKLVCDQYSAEFKEDLECVADIEKAMNVRCQESCLDQEGEDPAKVQTLKLVEPQGACRLSYCTLRCIANQVQECDSGDRFRSAYTDIGAAQMFLGIEERVGSRANRAHQVIKSQKVPIKCRTVIQKAISSASKVLTAKPKPLRTSISVSDV
ncbi:hypothetical protein QR680_004994 [Steinernema hermaphroditum]|uniref:Protein kinase domain-containing protein n=1 Tax=Steinernema hermaphroditum TaxID=289476 RepID=A0AA39LU33_9BILA|nr:hypothetical protein QR680_004994 [Steinernema hermaphroditum]